MVGAFSVADDGFGETILLLHDHALVRRATARLLRQLGYVVLVAGTPAEALALARASRGLGLLLTDVVLAGSSGGDAAQEIRTRLPQLPILYFAAHEAQGLELLGQGIQLLTKPFSRVELATAIRQTMVLLRSG